MTDNTITTPIQVEIRALLLGPRLGLFVAEDPEPGWVRTYGRFGWQRFPKFYLERYSVPAELTEYEWIEKELRLKGYECQFVETIIGKGDYNDDEPLEA